MQITAATASDIDPAVSCLATTFAHDPITGFLLQTGPDHRERVTRFFALLMGVRLALDMPETGRGGLGNATLWCMFRPHEARSPTEH